MDVIRTTLAASLALALSAGAAFAQAAPATAAPPAAAPKAKGGAKPRTAQSIACSQKANASDIHGKPRDAFMRKCKAGKA